MKKLFLALGLLPLFLAGCSTTITNLTPPQMARNTTGLYPFEVAWDSNQQTLYSESIKTYVQVGLEHYAMQRTPLLTNRWEVLVPVPADKEYLNYRYKFDYQYRAFSPVRRSNSKMSSPYQLHLINKQ